MENKKAEPSKQVSQSEKWLEENKEFLKKYNELIQNEDLPLKEYRHF